MNIRRLFPFLFLLTVSLALPTAAGAQAPAPAAHSAQWQAADTPRESAWVFIEDPASAEKIDIAVREHYVLISVNRPTPVKVFTILGQPVATRTIQPGTVRLRLPIRGIYILKAGETTRRINI